MTGDSSDVAAVRDALSELLPDRTLEAASVHERGHIHDTIVASCRSSAGLGAAPRRTGSGTKYFPQPNFAGDFRFFIRRLR